MALSEGCSIEVSGIDGMLKNIEHLNDAMHKTAELIMNEAVEGMKKVANPITPYRTGNLMRHNKTRMTENSTTRISGELYNDCEYAIYVFFGTRHMKGRDWMTPALLWAGRYIENTAPLIKLVE